jgi:hypothetical protein
LQFIPKQQKLTPEQQQLLDLVERIEPSECATLLAFAEFLASRQGTLKMEPEVSLPLEPKLVERPPQESVVKAIKRLSASYYMLQRDKLLDETSSLMTSHIIQGRDAKEVIDELENLFKKHYQDYLKDY